MVYKLIKTDNYLLVVDDSVHPYDSSKVGNPLAHLPLNGSPILEGVPLLPPYSRHQEDGIDKKSVDFIREIGGTEQQRLAFKDGYFEAREKYKYTEEDMIQCWNTASIDKHQVFGDQIGGYFKQYIQSLHQYPTEFECDMEQYYNEVGNDGFEFDSSSTIPPPRPKKITTAQGRQWVGKYK